MSSTETASGERPNIVSILIEAWRQRRGDVRVVTNERLVGLTGFAREMDVSVQAVQKWFDRGEVPHKRVLKAEAITGVPRHRIRPDLYPPAEAPPSIDAAA